MRVTRSISRRIRKKKILKMAKGFSGRSNTCYIAAIDRVKKSLQYQYRDRRNKKRDIRRLWITRINAAARTLGVNYSTFMNKIKLKGITLNRKSLSELAARDITLFQITFQDIIN
jgi:large subunit ribosomal protein L20